jgi:selenocysteine-specific elongation factor
VAERLVLGTAGHIDHGKTALIRALTGVDTDRLPQEKARGITIELGFAPLELDGGIRLGVVDVPGHEALVRTMVAGATGIDLVLLVVAADEGVMPQTREHVAICDLLGISRGLVALNKCDAAPEDVRELAAEEVADLLKDTTLAGAAIHEVSAIAGTGLDELRSALAALAAEVSAHTPRSGPPRLAVDRAFEMRGFGPVVTGTLFGSALSVGDTVEIHPGGRRARVRGLQSFGQTADQIEPGARSAVNLQGIPLSDLHRGMVLTAPDALAPTLAFDAELSWLAEAPPTGDSVAVELLAGTSERRARVAPIGSDSLVPGARGFGRIHVDGEPVALVPGDRFVLRGFARTALGGSTVGGGRVLDVAPPRRRRSDPALLDELERLTTADELEQIRLRIERAGYASVTADDLARETGTDRKRVTERLGELEAGGAAVPLAAGTWCSGGNAARLAQQLLATVARFHASEPLRPGIPRSTLAGTLPENAAAGLFEALLGRLERSGEVTSRAGFVARHDHRPVLDAEQEAMAAKVCATAKAAGLEPPTLAELAQELGVDDAALRDLLAYLERDGSLVRAPGDFWFDRAAVDELRKRVIAHLQEHGRLETTAYKAMIGTTRKWAVPLMELFDNEHLTTRRGDTRFPRRV